MPIPLRLLTRMLSLWAMVVLAGCDQPPSDQAIGAEIEAQVRRACSVAFDSSPAALEVAAIRVGRWNRHEDNLQGGLETTWTATLRLREPYAIALGAIGGIPIVRIVGPEGHTFSCSGRAYANRAAADQSWTLGVLVNATDAKEPWSAWVTPGGDATHAFASLPGGSSAGASAAVGLKPLSMFGPHVIEGSTAHHELAQAAQIEPASPDSDPAQAAAQSNPLPSHPQRP